MQVNKILFITLSNIGDVILTLPTLDYLRTQFPESKVTVMAGPRPKEIFEGNPCVSRLIVYDKHSGLGEKIKLFFALKKEKFDIIVDLRSSLFGALLPAKYNTSPFLKVPREKRHMKDKHLYKLSTVNSQLLTPKDIQTKSVYINPQDEKYIENILEENGITGQDKVVVIAPGARSHIKRWAKEKFIELVSSLMKEFGVKIVLVGDKDDTLIAKYIIAQDKAIDLIGKTTILQLACLLKKVSLLVTNDSAVLHLASYLNVPIVAVFGPTSEEKYGPWSDNCAVVKREIFCRPCEKAQCKFGTLECMSLIKVEDVLRRVRDMLGTGHRVQGTGHKDKFRRILIVRTDRIGDVLLSTPVIKAFRDNYPNAYIAMMVSPYAKEIVDANPYLDAVIIYDKEGKHKSWLRSLKFALRLKKKKFDLAVILHPTNRVHLITFLSGIFSRVGYNRKLGFLLTDSIEHTKQLGEKHELEYNLDLLRYLGIEAGDKTLFMPIKPEAEKWVEDLFRKQEIKPTDKLLAVHSGASCPSKIWPNERFAKVADRLIEKYGFKVLVVAGPKDTTLTENLIRHMQHPAINLAGKSSLSQLASLLKRCRLFISNDSGPVHIASAVGTPVISIFGRNQKGLSPLRWGPVGGKDCFLHKEVGCIECLAHNCTKDFACLKAITVEEVLNTVDLILNL